MVFRCIALPNRLAESCAAQKAGTVIGGRRKRGGPLVARVAYSTMTLLLLAQSVPGREAGWIGRTGFKKGSSPFSGAPPSENALRQFEREHLEEQASTMGIELMADEVGERKRAMILNGIARFCSVGTQITLIMGLGALVFRVFPSLMDPEEEDDDMKGHHLMALESGSPYSLPGAEQQCLLLGTSMGSEETRSAPRQPGEDSALVAALGNGAGSQDSAAEALVLVTKRRAALRKARRLSQPVLRAMAIPLVLLGAARLVLGDFLARRVDPMQELLFGDDIMMLYSDGQRSLGKPGVANRPPLQVDPAASAMAKGRASIRELHRADEQESSGGFT